MRRQELDGIRGIAIIMVLIWHYWVCQFEGTSNPYLLESLKIFSLFWSGVDLFFVLSGFLICGILLDNREASNLFKTFYYRRICRIFPVYYLFLFAFMLAKAFGLSARGEYSWLFGGPIPDASYFAFTQNLLMGVHNSFGCQWLAATWSLAVEEQFYLFLPFLVRRLDTRQLVCILVALVLMSPVLRAAYPNINSIVNTLFRCDSLLLGALAAMCVRSPGILARMKEHRALINVIFMVLVAGFVVLGFNRTNFGVLNRTWLSALFTTLILYPFIEPHGRLARLLKNRLLIFFGTISYGLYLFHQPVSGLLHGMLLGTQPQLYSLRQAGVTLLSLLASITLAVVSYYGFEKKVTDYGHGFKYEKKTRLSDPGA